MAKRKSKSFGKLWLVTLLLVIALVAGLLYLQKHAIPVKSVLNEKTIKSKIISQKPNFDFYTVLPEGKNQAAATPAIKKSTNALAQLPSAPPLTKPTASNNLKYILQIASVKNYADADRLKAELILMGYSVTVKKIIVNNVTWNRVNLGPYNSLASAQTAQADLQKNKIKSILLKNQATN